MLASRPVGFRRGAHSLAALAAASLGQDPFDGALIVFRTKRADRVKILLWGWQRSGVDLEAASAWRFSRATHRGWRNEADIG